MAYLLSPAGSFDALRAAIAAGADEVYLGGTQFNARAGARNFNEQQLIDAGVICRDSGVRMLITLNTLIEDKEFDAVLHYVNFLQTKVRPAAYIVQDLGLAAKLKEQFPEIVLHASTQLRQHSSSGAAILRGLGFSRIVLARELDKENIASFCAKSGIESEVFVHGALCVCESGGCLMSSMIGRRSGNRGECAQPCRLPYKGANPYPLSLKDNCLAPYLQELSDMGVTAFKIEGRMKSPDYVYLVTSTYRMLMDEHRAPTKAELDKLQNAFSRNGFTAGYYQKKVTPSMFGIRRAEDKKKTEQLRIDKQPLPHQRDPQKETALPFCMPQKDASRLFPPKQQLGYVARLEGNIPKSLAMFADACRIDIPLYRLHETNIQGFEDKISVILPRVVFDSEEKMLCKHLETAWNAGVRHATVPNLSLLPFVSRFYLHGDYPLNVYNQETVRLLEGYSFSSLFLSPETDGKSFGFASLAYEMLGYGRLPLMQTETCIIRNIKGNCPGDHTRCKAELVDRTGASFPVLRADGHRNLIYNSLPTYRLDRRKELKKSGVGLLTLLFTTETETEIQSVLQAYRNSAPPSGKFTRR